MRIGQVAKHTGLKVETVRFYEAEGLIDQPERSGGNYRIYGQSHVDRLSFIKRSRALGFTLDQVRSLLKLADDPRASCAQADAIVEDHVGLIDRKLAELGELRAEIMAWGRACKTTTVAECRVIEALSR